MNEDILPTITSVDRPFWEATRNRELRAQKCDECGELRWPPSGVCHECWATSAEWVELSGNGVVNSWVVFHRAFLPEFEDEVPYPVVEVDLEEGIRYVARLVDCDSSDLYRGMPVEVIYEDVTDEITLPKFTVRE